MYGCVGVWGVGGWEGGKGVEEGTSLGLGS